MDWYWMEKVFQTIEMEWNLVGVEKDDHIIVTQISINNWPIDPEWVTDGKVHKVGNRTIQFRIEKDQE